MGNMPGSNDGLHHFAEEIKSLFHLDGFSSLPELKEVFIPIKELIKTNDFKELSELKDIYIPIKEINIFDPLFGKKNNEDNKDKKGNDGSGSNRENKESKDRNSD